MPTRKIDYDKYAAGIFNRTERYANQVRRHFEAAVEQLLDISASMDLAEGDVFSFSANHRLSEEANNILRNLYANVYQDIRGGIASEWRFANLSADALVKSIFGKMAESDHFARYFMRNQDAMDAFFSRTSAYGGLNLSQRIWNYTGQFKDEMELALSVSMGRGESASTISRRVRGYLREPDRLFRRVRDEKDNRRLSKKAAAYHPGRGVYRSSYKNAMRLTRTETNMAYRTADHLRWQQMDFVIGIEIRTSNHHPAPDICDDLKGRYPKDFKFVGWHPQCRCFAVPILSDLDDMLKWGRAVLDGTASIDDYSPEQITDMPKAFNNWVKDNAERITTAEYQPYFIRDNIERVNQIISTHKVERIIADATAPFEHFTYAAFEPFSPIIIEKLRELRHVAQQQRLLQSIVDDTETFSIINIAPSGARTTTHAGHKMKSKDNWAATKQMAEELNVDGKSVVFLPEYDVITSADALVTNVAGRIRVADFKHVTTTSWNTLQGDLEAGFIQAPTIVLKLVNMDAEGFINTIDYMVRNKMKIGNIVLMNKYGRHIDLLADALKAGRYKKKVRGFL